MKPLTNFINNELVWLQPEVSERRFELRSGPALLATLRFESDFGSLALAESTAGHWTLERQGFLNPRVVVRQVAATVDLATFQPDWMGSEGTLSFGDGRTFGWKSGNFWGNQRLLVDATGETLVTYHTTLNKTRRLLDILKTEATVIVHPSARTVADLMLLLVCGWYLKVLQEEEAVVVSAVV
ncbi:MAG: hypothetical protein ACOYZ7_04705 [Chloroflexota bacterium]